MKELFEAIRAADLSRVAALVEADPSLAIFAAAIMGEPSEIEELLAGNRSLVSVLSSDGWTPLHLAAFFGQSDAARVAVEQGRAGERALHQCHAEHAAARRRSRQACRDGQAAAGAWRSAERAAARRMDAAARRRAEWRSGNGQDIGGGGRGCSRRAPKTIRRALDLALTKGQQGMVDFLEANGASL